jgi:hypothetical protein
VATIGKVTQPQSLKFYILFRQDIIIIMTAVLMSEWCSFFCVIGFGIALHCIGLDWIASTVAINQNIPE